MPKKLQVVTRAAVSLAFFILLAAPYAAALAQNVATGTWTASGDPEKPGKISLSLERGGKSQIGHTYDLADLQGLSREQASGTGPVRFSLVREAGRIDCEGSFQNGKGSGTFSFTANQGFVSAMKSRGLDFEQDNVRSKGGREAEDRLFVAAALDVTTALADDLLSAGFGKLGVEDLIKATIFKVDSKFAGEMRAMGFPDLGLEELVKARIFKIDAEAVRRAAQMGFVKQPLESLVKMQIFKITPEFVAEARGEGLTNLSVEEFVQLRIFKIDADFIRRAKAEGVPVEVESLVQRRIGERHRAR
jgi:hypothetical protein